MNKVLVTGAAGFVGSAVVKECLNKGFKVFAFDIVDDPSDRLPLDNKNLVYFKKDLKNIGDFTQKLGTEEIDICFHFAWNGSSGPLRDDYNTQTDNVLLSIEILKFAKKIGCKKFIFAGTIMEFETIDCIYTQESKPQMGNIYGAGKSLAHLFMKPVANQLGIDLVWAYITNSYGVGELSPRLVNTTIRNCIEHKELNFTSATQNYDFIYIDDVARAFYLLGLYGKANKAYLVGSGEAKPLKEFLLKIIEICGENVNPNFGAASLNAINLPLDRFSIEEIKKDCGFAPLVSFEEGIIKTFNWIKREVK